MRLLNRFLIPIFMAFLLPLVSAGQQAQKPDAEDLFGLYYGDWSGKGSGLAMVISSNGQPIPPKENDPQAPTRPGFYVGEQQFEFAWSKFSPQGFSFRTKNVHGTVFSFQGRFGREHVDDISEVPYLAGVLTEIRDAHVVRKKSLHFAHAVVL